MKNFDNHILFCPKPTDYENCIFVFGLKFALKICTTNSDVCVCVCVLGYPEHLHTESLVLTARGPFFLLSPLPSLPLSLCS